MTNDELIERLGQAQQKIMSLTVQNRALKKQVENIEYRADVLEALVMDVVADIQDNVLRAVILERIAKVMERFVADD